MAQEILVFSVGQVLKKVVSLASEEISLTWGFEKELRALQASLTMIELAVQDAGEKQATDIAVNLWLQKLKDVVYGAEDVLDEFEYEFLRRKLEIKNQLKNQVHNCLSQSNSIMFIPDMAHRFQKVNLLLDEIKKDGANLGLSPREGMPDRIPQTGSIPDTDPNEKLCVLRSSFSRLPTTSLKQCFAYCALFPKDFEIEKHKIIELWMAEGLLQPYHDSENECSLEDIGEEHLSFFVTNLLVRDVKRDYLGHIKSFKMHDAAHDLAQYVSRSETWTSEQGDYVDNVLNLRRINLVREKEMLQTLGMASCKNLRVLFSKVDVFSNTLWDFKSLRALDLSDSDIQSLPPSVGESKHLRFLDVSRTPITSLPESIAELYHLQTLRFLNCRYLQKLPKGVENLVKLKHIHFSGPWLMPIWIGRLTCLQTLPMFIVDTEESRGIEELGSLSQLSGRLKISGLKHVRDKNEASRADLRGKPNIYQLEYEFTSKNELRLGLDNDMEVLEGLQPHPNLQILCISTYKCEKFPSWCSDPKVLGSLVKLSLAYCPNSVELPTLGQLPCLEILKVNYARVKHIGEDFFYNNHGGASTRSSNGEIRPVILFQSLRKLTLKYMGKLESWVVPKDTVVFPCLKKLKLVDCRRTATLPLSQFASLQHLKISTCAELRELGDEGLFPLTQLESMEVFCCRFLTRLPSLHDLTSLVELSVSSCGLTSFPNELHCCKNLQHLSITSCWNLLSIPDCLGELSSLDFLAISHCDKLTYLPVESLGRLTRLKKMYLGAFSEELEEFPDLRHLGSFVADLHLTGWNRLKALPQIQQLTSLIHLFVTNFNGLEALPEWLGDLASLQSLSVTCCESIKYLPSAEAMRRLTSLEHIGIHRCPELKKRWYHSETEYSKITHIPSVVIDEQQLHWGSNRRRRG